MATHRNAQIAQKACLMIRPSTSYCNTLQRNNRGKQIQVKCNYELQMILDMSLFLYFHGFTNIKSFAVANHMTLI